MNRTVVTGFFEPIKNPYAEFIAYTDSIDNDKHIIKKVCEPNIYKFKSKTSIAMCAVCARFLHDNIVYVNVTQGRVIESYIDFFCFNCNDGSSLIDGDII